MPWNGSGSFTRNQDFTADRDAGAPDHIIDADKMDDEFDNFDTGIENCLTRDGQNTPSANLPMGSFKHTGVAVAAARTDYARASQVQDSALTWCGTSSGTNTVTATAPISMTAYAAGQVFSFLAGGTNTGATTLNLNSIGAKAIQKNGAALVAGDITANDIVSVVYDGTQFQMVSPARTPVLTAAGIPASALNVNGATSATPAAGDEFIFGDVSDSNNRKKGTVQGIVDLIPNSWVALKTVTANNDATIDFVNGSGGVVLDSTYKAYYIELINVIPATDGADLYFRTSTNTGSSYDASGTDYDYAWDFVGQGSNTNEASTGAAQILLAKSVGSDTGESLSGHLKMCNPAETSNKKLVTFLMGWATNAAEFKASVGGGFRDATSDVDAVRFLFSSGNIESGTFTLYGLRSAA